MRRPLLIIVLNTAAALDGAAQVPQRMCLAAQSAMTRAEAECAQLYASNLFQAAHDAMVAGHLAVASGNYSRAQDLYQTTHALGEAAVHYAHRQRQALGVLVDSTGWPTCLTPARLN